MKPLIDVESMLHVNLSDIILLNNGNENTKHLYFYAFLQSQNVYSLDVSSIALFDLTYKFVFLFVISDTTANNIGNIYLDYRNDKSGGTSAANFKSMFYLSRNYYNTLNNITVHGNNLDSSEMIIFDIHSCDQISMYGINITSLIGVDSLVNVRNFLFTTTSIHIINSHISGLQASNTNNNRGLIDISGGVVNVIIENSYFTDNSNFASVIACVDGSICEITIKSSQFMDNFGKLELSNGSCIENVNGIFIDQESGAFGNITLIDTIVQADTNECDRIVQGLITFDSSVDNDNSTQVVFNTIGTWIFCWSIFGPVTLPPTRMFILR